MLRLNPTLPHPRAASAGSWRRRTACATASCTASSPTRAARLCRWGAPAAGSGERCAMGPGSWATRGRLAFDSWPCPTTAAPCLRLGPLTAAGAVRGVWPDGRRGHDLRVSGQRWGARMGGLACMQWVHACMQGSAHMRWGTCTAPRALHQAMHTHPQAAHLCDGARRAQRDHQARAQRLQHRPLPRGAGGPLRGLRGRRLGARVPATSPCRGWWRRRRRSQAALCRAVLAARRSILRAGSHAPGTFQNQTPRRAT